MSRLRSIFRRYGGRTIFVILALSDTRLANVSSMLVLYWLKLITLGRKGKGIRFGRDIFVSPGGHLNLGDGLYIGDRCVFEIYINPQAHVTIGSDTWISHDCHITSNKEVRIGEQVLIGEFVSIRDSTHCHADIKVPVKKQQDVIGSLVIEDEVWIGRGCLIQGRPEGVVIGRGAVIAANSVVTRSVPPLEIWGGVPAHFIKHR